MKIVLSTTALAGILIFSSCNKNKYCYQCTAQGSQNWNFGQQVSEQECDLSKKDRDKKAQDFEYAHPTNEWNRTCTRTSN